MKIAIYGLSSETEKALPDLLKKYNIVGLLDGFKTDGFMYGQPIISLDAAIAAGINRIIVVARPGSCKAIVKRIGDLCSENNVEVFDIRGNNLLQDIPVHYDFAGSKGYTKADILAAAMEVNAVSFDLFDTLVVRNCLLPTDVIEILFAKLVEEGWFAANGINPDSFVEKRIAAEKQLSIAGKAPTLAEIYYEVVGDKALADTLAIKEYETDLLLLEVRSEMPGILSAIKALGKDVYITSDTYYSHEQIAYLLDSKGIDGYSQLVLSCEHTTSKTGKLYEVLKEAAGTDDILHIGDDVVSDIEKANERKLKTFKIYSAAELLDLLGGLGLEKHIANLFDRIRVGMFAAQLFNSPFQFEDNNSKVHIDKAQDIGSLLFAPVVMDFVSWFIQETGKAQITNIWFGARDGYLIKKLYESMKGNAVSEYFYTSRTVAVRAGVTDEQDIEYVDSMKYSGNLSDNLKTRFGINVEDISPNEVDDAKDGLLKYSKTILDNAAVQRGNYRKYICGLLANEKPIAFFDFVAKGTTQYFLQRLIDNHICGYYFMQLETDAFKDKGVEIVPFYPEEERAMSAIFESYYVLETVLTAPHASVDAFDADGKPIYAEETRSRENIECVMSMQDGIMDYVQKYISICPRSVQQTNKKMDEAILSLISKVDIRDNGFMDLVVEDPFFNRMTNISDII